MRRTCTFLIALTLTAILMIAAGPAFADDTVVYDAADFPNMSGRTKQEVIDKYTWAKSQGNTYVNGGSNTYYSEPCSLKDPYAYGVLSSDTLKAMEGMSNFWRWLIGVNDLSVNTESDLSLQAQAFDRNWQFDHYISNSSKPDDMSDEMWQVGYPCSHNILARGSTPAGAVTAWLNEGYSLSSGSFNTVGHRTAILNAGYSGITYGYSGSIAIGKCGSGGNSFDNAFAAFPAAGYMPSGLLSKGGSSWTVQLNTSKVRGATADDITITVQNLTTGNSYTCTNGNGMASNSTAFLNFVQPSDVSGNYYTDPYKVTVTGLQDVATGNAAEITYTVSFFDLTEIWYMDLPRSDYAYTGSEIKPVPVVHDEDDNILTEGEDYTVKYYDNVEEGLGIVEVTGKGDYCGVIRKAFSIQVDRKDISQSIVSVTSTHPYTGSPITPEVTVTHFGTTLTENVDYTVKYENNLNVGNAIVTVTGIGEYTGSQQKTVWIYQAYPNLYARIDTNPVEVGGSARIIVTQRGDGLISFKSSDESVATVDQDGTVHAVGEGSAQITVSSAETHNYYSQTRTVDVNTSKDVHTMEDYEVTYATEDNNTATVVRKCKVCGREETSSFTCMDSFSLWYWTGSYGYSYMDSTQTEGTNMSVEIRASSPSDAENTDLVLETSDPDIMTVDGLNFRFVGAGEVTLTIYAKYRPSVKRVHKIKVEHVYGTGVVTKEATCCETGTMTYTCTVCGHTDEREINKDPDNHAGGTELRNVKAETCGADGYSGDLCCRGCDAVLEEGRVIPATGEHSYDEGTVTEEPDCIHEGEKKFTCNVCGDSYTENVPATGIHTWTDEYTVEKEPDCVNTGIGAKYCTVCGKRDDGSEKIIPALGHDMTKVPEKSAGCEEAGNIEYYTCGRCGKYFRDEEGETVTDPDEVVVPAHGHDFGAWKDYSDTKHVRYCSYDDSHTEYADHVWNDGLIEVEPTCYLEGVLLRKCADCGREMREPITKTAHEMTEIPAKDPTCSTDGNIRYFHCRGCNCLFRDEKGEEEISEKDTVIPALGHDLGEWESKDGSSHTRKCRREGCGYVETAVHSWDEGKVITEPGCVSEGEQELTCTDCGEVRYAPIPALGHDIKEVPENAPTCTENGCAAHYECKRCGWLFSDAEGTQLIYADDVVIDAKGHAYGAWTPIDGEQHRRVCEHDPSHIEDAEHVWDEGVVITEPTLTEEGLRKITCTECGFEKEETIPVIPDPKDQMGDDGTPIGKGASYEAAEAAITGLKADTDPKGSKIAPLLFRSTRQSRSYIKLAWKKPSGAVKFVLYGNKCGKSNRMKKLKDLTGTSVTVKKAAAKLKKGTYYKFILVSLDKDNNVISTSKILHVATAGGKVGNYKAVKTAAKKNRVTVKKGRTFKLAGKGVPASRKLKIVKHTNIRYETTKKDVASVSSKGLIKGVKRGVCYVYVNTQSGTYAKIKVTVK